MIDGIKEYLPLDGEWGLGILDKSFWDSCHFPRTYELSRDFGSFKNRGNTGQYLIRLEEGEFPRQFLESAESPLFFYWEDEFFSPRWLYWVGERSTNLLLASSSSC